MPYRAVTRRLVMLATAATTALATALATTALAAAAWPAVSVSAATASPATRAAATSPAVGHTATSAAAATSPAVGHTATSGAATSAAAGLLPVNYDFAAGRSPPSTPRARPRRARTISPANPAPPILTRWSWCTGRWPI